jgi:hypothetical protein
MIVALLIKFEFDATKESKIFLPTSGACRVVHFPGVHDPFPQPAFFSRLSAKQRGVL